MRLYTTSLLTLVLYVSVSGSSAFKCSTSPQSSEIQKYKVCGTDNQTRQSYSEDFGFGKDITKWNSSTEADDGECWYTYSPTFDHCGPDTLPTSPACWKVLDANGSVEVSFSLLPQRCNYNSYKAQLRVYETSDHKCLSHGNEGIHSERDLSIENCSMPSCSGPCIQRGTLTFRHVFSGCYQLLLIPYQNLQAYSAHQLETGFSYLNTEHVKTPIQSGMNLRHEVTSEGRNVLEVGYVHPRSVLHIKLHLFKLVSLMGNKCGGGSLTSVFLNTTSLCEHRYITCDSDFGKSKVSCSYQNEKVIACEFSQLKAGNYCVRLAFYDDRCRRDTVWDDNDTWDTPKCNWETEIIEIIPKEAATEIRKTELDIRHNIRLLMIPLLIFLVLVIFGVTWWTRRHRKDPYNKFSPLTPTITTQVTDRPRVLLLYARDCPAFLEAVTQLRKVLRRACDCEVMDCWEESQFQNVAQNSAHWVMSNLSEDKVRTVLITSPASLLFESCMVKGSQVCYKQPKAFDRILELALNHLHENYSHETYRRLFIVRLDSKVEGMLHRSTTYLNPLTTYELPVHLNALLANLQNMNPTECSFLRDMAPDVSLLTNAISEYRLYLSEHPRYLDSLLVTENSTTVHSVQE